ncbi:MAG: DUF805 domain-containing protein [Pseudolabrys sp.]|nr:DUF805 domain-containing protein [Pseudolabrys sp.]
MGFVEAIQSGFNNYATFSGRAARSEYWYWTLFNLIVSIVAGIVDIVIGLDLLQAIVGLALLLPSLAVAARRLHDLDRTAWWLLIALTLIGCILLLIWDCIKGTPGPNRFGPDPLPL